jgi:hypothetical protein
MRTLETRSLSAKKMRHGQSDDEQREYLCPRLDKVLRDFENLSTILASHT